MGIPEGFFKPGERVPADPDATAIEVGYVDGYRVVYTHYKDTWSAKSPDVPGVFAGGDTREEAEQAIRAAIPFHLEGVELDRAEASAKA